MTALSACFTACGSFTFNLLNSSKPFLLRVDLLSPYYAALDSEDKLYMGDCFNCINLFLT